MDTDPEYAWRYQAKCKGIDTNVFYPPRDRKLYKPIADKAKAICWGTGDDDPECPARSECLWYAISMDDTHGIWGGLSHRERSHLYRKWKRLKLSVTFKDYILGWTGDNKAKRHTKRILADQEGRVATDRSYRKVSAYKARDLNKAAGRTPPV